MPPPFCGREAGSLAPFRRRGLSAKPTGGFPREAEITPPTPDLHRNALRLFDETDTIWPYTSGMILCIMNNQISAFPSLQSSLNASNLKNFFRAVRVCCRDARRGNGPNASPSHAHGQPSAKCGYHSSLLSHRGLQRQKAVFDRTYLGTFLIPGPRGEGSRADHGA